MVDKFEILVLAYVALVIFVIGFRHRAEVVVAITVVTPVGAFFVVVEDTHPLFCLGCEAGLICAGSAAAGGDSNNHQYCHSRHRAKC
jgi:hypothetical protein